MLKIIYLLAICSFCVAEPTGLETVDDKKLIDLMSYGDFVVVLFTKEDCPTCDNYENELINLKDDLINSMIPAVVKVVNSRLHKVYILDEEPVLVFFRYGIPLLYDGPLNGEEILTLFMENKGPTVKQLTDDTFEHLTQASSGATTGDWFVMFYSADCKESVRMSYKWETVGAKLKHRVNVARIDIHTTGVSTARRFKVSDIPAYIFFRHGKMYRYEIPKYEINAFVSFAKDWYKNARAEIVPVPQSPFDNFVETIANGLRDNPWIMKLGSITIGVLIIISVASKFRRKPEMPQKKE